jgi:hypothetical protein
MNATKMGGMSLHDMAIIDPIQACMLARGYSRRPVTMNTAGIFSSLALGQGPIQNPLDQQISKRTWVDNFAYNLVLPNAFVGNVFLPDAMAKLKENTGITIKQTIMSGPRFVITDTFTPLENYVNAMWARWPAGWQINRNQQLLTEFMLTAIPFNDPSNTPPYGTNLTLNGFQFDDMSCDEMSVDDAQCELVDRGLLEVKEIRGKKCYCPRYL